MVRISRICIAAPLATLTGFSAFRGATAEYVTERITADEARRELIDLRERVLRQQFPNSDPTRGLLRKTMLDALLRNRPKSQQEWIERMPGYLLDSVEQHQLRLLPEVFAIIKRIA